MITALLKSNEIVHADCEAFRAMVNDLEEASTKRETETERAAKQQAIEDYADYASTHSVATSQSNYTYNTSPSDSESSAAWCSPLSLPHVDVQACQALSMDRFISSMSTEQLTGLKHAAELSHADTGLAFPNETAFLKRFTSCSDMGGTELSNTQVVGVKAEPSELSTRVKSTPRARVEQQKDTFWRPSGSSNTIV